MLFSCEKPLQLLTFCDVSDPYGRSSNLQMWFEYLAAWFTVSTRDMIINASGADDWHGTKGKCKGFL